MEYIYTIILILVLIVLSSLFIYLIRKENKRYKDDKILNSKEELQEEDLLQILSRLYNKKSSRNEFSLMLINVDDFTNIRRDLTHEEENHVISVYKNAIKTFLTQDVVFAKTRKVDEYLLYLPSRYDFGRVLKLAENIKKISERRIEVYAKSPVMLRTSIAMTNFPNHGDTVSEVYEALKLCMYDIKQAGGNQMRYYSAEINQNQESFQLSLELKKALEEDQFIFHYQPIVDVSNNRKIIAVESLVRWNHPTRGLLYPGKFISLLESSGNLEKVGLSGFEKGVSFIRQVKLETEQDIKISVNLSPRQILINKNIVFFKRIADKYRIKPENIIIELPDFASYSNNLNLLKNTTQLMNLGFRIAIDVDTVDYKIINAIPNYPINIIKINAKILKGNDKSFVASFVENLSELAIRSKIEVIAEGVESLEQQEVFTRYGIHMMQGYFYYEPIDENKLKETMLHNINVT